MRNRKPAGSAAIKKAHKASAMADILSKEAECEFAVSMPD
jgi:hypothetical protein